MLSMNVSGRTKILLQGAYLWACVQDEPSKVTPHVEREWDAWSEAHPFMVTLAKKIQYETFDRINAIL